MIEVLVLLVLLQIKHWYIDFVNQNNVEVAHKGIYGNWLGAKHSIKHGLGTLVALWIVTGGEYFVYLLTVAIADIFLHYHIDWAKMNWGNRDINNPKFWNHLGLDQMAHQLCYIFYAGIMIL